MFEEFLTGLKSLKIIVSEHKKNPKMFLSVKLYGKYYMKIEEMKDTLF